MMPLLTKLLAFLLLFPFYPAIYALPTHVSQACRPSMHTSGAHGNHKHCPMLLKGGAKRGHGLSEIRGGGAHKYADASLFDIVRQFVPLGSLHAHMRPEIFDFPDVSSLRYLPRAMHASMQHLSCLYSISPASLGNIAGLCALIWQETLPCYL